MIDVLSARDHRVDQTPGPMTDDGAIIVVFITHYDYFIRRVIIVLTAVLSHPKNGEPLQLTTRPTAVYESVRPGEKTKQKKTIFMEDIATPLCACTNNKTCNGLYSLYYQLASFQKVDVYNLLLH